MSTSQSMKVVGKSVFPEVRNYSKARKYDAQRSHKQVHKVGNFTVYTDASSGNEAPSDSVVAKVSAWMKTTSNTFTENISPTKQHCKLNWGKRKLDEELSDLSSATQDLQISGILANKQLDNDGKDKNSARCGRMSLSGGRTPLSPKKMRLNPQGLSLRNQNEIRMESRENAIKKRSQQLLSENYRQKITARKPPPTPPPTRCSSNERLAPQLGEKGREAGKSGGLTVEESMGEQPTQTTATPTNTNTLQEGDESMVSVYMLTYSTSSSDQNESNGSIEITREAQDIPEPTWRSSPGYGSTFHPVHTTVKEVQTKALTKAPCVVSKSHERSTSKAKMTTDAEQDMDTTAFQSTQVRPPLNSTLVPGRFAVNIDEVDISPEQSIIKGDYDAASNETTPVKPSQSLSPDPGTPMKSRKFGHQRSGHLQPKSSTFMFHTQLQGTDDDAIPDMSSIHHQSKDEDDRLDRSTIKPSSRLLEDSNTTHVEGPTPLDMSSSSGSERKRTRFLLRMGEEEVIPDSFLFVKPAPLHLPQISPSRSILKKSYNLPDRVPRKIISTPCKSMFKEMSTINLSEIPGPVYGEDELDLGTTTREVNSDEILCISEDLEEVDHQAVEIPQTVEDIHSMDGVEILRPAAPVVEPIVDDGLTLELAPQPEMFTPPMTEKKHLFPSKTPVEISYKEPEKSADFNSTNSLGGTEIPECCITTMSDSRKLKKVPFKVKRRRLSSKLKKKIENAPRDILETLEAIR